MLLFNQWRKDVSMNRKLGALAAILTLLASSPYPAFADPNYKGYRAHRQRAQAAREYASGLKRLSNGDYVDRDGWRYRQGFGWDNTCFHLNYLDSQFACNAGGGRR